MDCIIRGPKQRLEFGFELELDFSPTEMYEMWDDGFVIRSLW